MSMTPAPGEDTSVALALVNTWYGDPNGFVDDLGPQWLRTRSLASAPRVSAPEFMELIGLRAAIRELFTALADQREPAADSVALVNDCARRWPIAPQLAWPPDGPRREWSGGTESNGVDEAIATIARDAIDVVCGDRAPTVRRCAAHGCVRIFFRAHARRQWCSNTCGDRVRAARHYLRQTGRAS
ncbi:MAG TPA: CGNR zinc finger domain-containing protein [Pseudonocardiaceae bacterium]|nr:CGNR zinc finger domain-containing protein [Pseudonocardiaceae bacterium]